MIPFNPAEFKALLLEYVVAENQAYTTIESTRLQAILKYLNPAVDQRGCLPVHKTIHNWIEVAFEANVGLIQEFLRSAQSKINLAFDLWTSRRLTAFCGVTAHFCDHNGRYRSFLLAILEHTTSHAGTDISQTLQHSLRPPQGLVPATQPSQEPAITPQRRTRQKASQRAQVPTPPTTQIPILETQDSQPTVPSHAATQAYSQATED
jgi:hypothetical protein